MSVTAIVMAAGKGTRMKSDLPKPLHRARGRTLLDWVLHALAPETFDAVVAVVGHEGDQVVASVNASFPGRDISFAEQLSQRGTGDAAAVGLQALDSSVPSFTDDDHVLVLPGDTPLLQAETLQAVVQAHLEADVAGTVVTARVADPTGYGRIIRSDAGVTGIIEHRDATAEQRRIDEINSSIYCFRRSLLSPALRMIDSNNAQGEMYLTDVVGVLVEAGHRIEGFGIDAVEISGVNDRFQLSAAADALGERINAAHMRAGVSLERPSSVVIDADVTIEPDATIRAQSVLEGRTAVGAGAIVGPSTHLIDAEIGSGARVPHSVISGASVAPNSSVEPFSNISNT